MKQKRLQKPCMFLYQEEGKPPVMVKPDVACSKHCSHCGWNPEEKERRLREGNFIKDASVRIRHYVDENDTRGHTVIYGGLQQLQFPVAEEKPSGESA